MPEGSPQWPRYVFSARSCGYMYDPPNDSKLAFVTPDNYCHLCHEPVEVAIRHCAWWDHVTRQAAVRLIAIQPRRWDATAVLQQAQNDLPASVMETPRPHPFLAHSPISVDADDPALVDMSTCYVFEREAVVRRAELAAILRVLCTTQTATIESCNSASDKGSDGVSSRPLLFHSLFPSPGGSPAANVGERTFRAYISRQISVLLPPMAPEPTTRIQQRCWGRKNLEMMFDLLGVASLQKLVGVPTVAATKNEKATVIRQVVYELATVLSEKHVVASSNASCTGSDLDAVDTAEQTRLLVELALQRLAHELIHLHTMLLMEQAWGTYAALGFPTESVVEASSFC
ncbi:hypothetical protein DQ04_04191000 [Trypanosoma grayi]|uniref:hypothetical protein n=1 Tax=Trypanosoma grayi TaxID=71804 RepID=UPI0004F49802|nr:hypothetical protein DQ04_04191000 [Trypanosoma grayi]KEG10089.1 hypothetical protein DQ04_04191000 [Trypanosoma grayi]